MLPVSWMAPSFCPLLTAIKSLRNLKVSEVSEAVFTASISHQIGYSNLRTDPLLGS
jgi:hypothetical protein